VSCCIATAFQANTMPVSFDSTHPPDLSWRPIPSGSAICKVHLIQAGGLAIPTDMALLPGPDRPTDPKDSDQKDDKPKKFYAPDYVFLIEHTATGDKYLFDLGIRKDLENLPPTIVKNVLPQFDCEPKSPAEILQEHGTPDQQPEKVKAVIFSHMHFDHVGDGAKAGFENAELWVGPTCCTYARPGYPVDDKAPTLSETLPTDGSRQIFEAFVPDELLHEAKDKRAGKVMEGLQKGLYNAVALKKADWIGLGSFDRAFDVFGDGSAYLIDAPGHSAGHQMMLIRTTTGSGDDTFVLLAGDCFHHPDLLKEPRRTARPPYSKGGMHSDPEPALDTIYRTKEFAEKDNIWVVAAHDFSVGENIQPGVKEIQGLVQINDWRAKKWKKPLHGKL
jgi:glyoxylase-like metal-dependent hydrolase (beta-lactamase superfamily II)